MMVSRILSRFLVAALLIAAAAYADDAGEVRAVLEGWRDAIARQDSEAVFRSYADTIRTSDGTPVSREEYRGRIRRSFFGRRAPQMVIENAEVTVTDSNAVAGLIIAITPWHAYRTTFLFRKEPVGWRIYMAEQQGPVAVELGLSGLGDEYVALMERWSQANLNWVQKTLWGNPPGDGDARLRQQALLMLDEPLHLRSAPQLKSVGGFLRANADHAIAEMRSEEVTEGATIWKLYNHGWVVKTANHSWAHDLYAGSGDAAMSDEQIDAILGEVEALFCSHWHGDHTSVPVLQRALEKGVPVFVSPLPGGDSDRGRMLRRRLTDSEDDDAPLPDNLTVVELGGRGEVAGMPYYAYPGHQGDFPNCVFVVEADGMVCMQTGDQSNDEDFRWIDRVSEDYAVDVLLPNVWTTDLPRMIRGVKPRFVIPGHENEIGHSFEHREPYDQAYERLMPIEESAWYVLAWGERVHIGRRNGTPRSE